MAVRRVPASSSGPDTLSRAPVRAPRRRPFLIAVCVAAAMLLATPATSIADETATVTDPTGDTPASFVSAKADVTRVTISWAKESGNLTVVVTYAAPPPSPTIWLLVSSQVADPLRTVAGVECVATNDAISVSADDATGRATLKVAGIEGSLQSEPAWSDTTVTFRFTSPALQKRFAEVNPFVCVQGGTDDDEFSGGFDGQSVRLTARVAAQGVRNELSDRWGVGSSPHTHVRCLSRGIRDEDSGEEGAPLRLCAFRAIVGRTVRFGEAAVYLESGDTRIGYIFASAFPRGTKECGTTVLGRAGWLLAPFPQDFSGVSWSAWAKNTSCRAARRIARSGPRRRATGWRCVTLKSGYEYIKQRCRRGGRTVWYDTGA